MKTLTLKKMPYAQAKVLIDASDLFTNHGNADVALCSYSTIVACISNGYLECYDLYSATTRKHISAFMREYTKFDYQAAKRAYQENKRLNLTTGEFEDRV